MVICTEIKFIKHLNQQVDLLEVSFDDGKSALMVATYGDVLQYLNQEVIVTFRQDIYEGRLTDFINDWTIPTKVLTLDRDDSVKLYVDSNDNQSNVSFRDIKVGEVVLNAEMYCISHTYESSPSAVWALLKVRDSSMRVSKLRFFDYESNKFNFQGMYIRADIRKTEFGFTTKQIMPLQGNETINPEIAISEKAILQHFSDDKEMLDIISKTNIIEFMKQYIDVERGYLVVRTAMELCLANEINNIAKVTDIVDLKRAILLQKMHVITPDSGLSKQTASFINVTREKFEGKRKLLYILDGQDEDMCAILKRIQDTVDTLISIRRLA